MKRKILLLVAIVSSSSFLMAQTSLLERRILGTGGQITDTLDNGTIITLDLSTDDVEQIDNIPNMTQEVDSRFDDDLDAGWEGEPADQNAVHVGFRFRNLALIQGSDIDSAFIELHAHEGKAATDVCELTIVGENTDDALTFDQANFNDNFLLQDRPQTTAEVSWTVNTAWTIWQPYRTPDLSAIVQEIVDRPGWSSGNAMAFFLYGEDQGPSTVENAREFTSFENIADPDDQDPQGNPGDGTNHPEWRPKLIVYVNGPLGTEEHVIKPVRVYPNPVTSGVLRMELNSEDPAKIDLVNVYGQLVRSIEVTERKANINVEGISKGLYMLNVTQGKKSFSQKVIIE